jgi:hypothetical protein
MKVKVTKQQRRGTVR